MTKTQVDTRTFKATANSNGRVFRWIAGSLFTVCIFITALYVGRIEAQVDKNTEEVVEMKGDLKLIKYQTAQILGILENRRDSL